MLHDEDSYIYLYLDIYAMKIHIRKLSDFVYMHKR